MPTAERPQIFSQGIDGIEREAVESSNIASIGYAPDRQTLAVQFSNGDVFHYAPAGIEFAAEFYAAESKGKFYSARIRGKIAGRLMTGPCASCGIKGPVGETCTDCGTNVHVERERRRLNEVEKAIEWQAAAEARR